MTLLRPVLRALFALCLLTCPLPATWSIILIDVRTGEIAIGSATCLSGLDLRSFVPVVVVGKGAGAAQHIVDKCGENRILMFHELGRGTPPAQIMEMIRRQDVNFPTRQLAIVDTAGAVAQSSPPRISAWAGDATGRAGDVVFAVQGNSLTGAPVVQMMDAAIHNTTGNLGEKLMAAMQAARSMGGDGRCSCDIFNPTRCGSPPFRFRKSAHVGFMIVARQGDVDGACDSGFGCAQGTYYMNLNISGPNGGAGARDPVAQLQELFDLFQRRKRGKPDHHLSTVTLGRADLPADGQTTTTATVRLIDLDGTALQSGGATLTVTVDPSSTAPVAVGAVTDHGDGSYSFPVTAGNAVGEARLRVVVDIGGGTRPILLSPRTSVTLDVEPLWASATELRLGAGGRVDFVLNAGREAALRPWILLASNSGSTPGIPLGNGLVLPLNPDGVLHATLTGAFGGQFPQLIGLVPFHGRVTTALEFPASVYDLPGGTALTFAAALWNPVDAVSNPVDVELR